MKPLVKINIAAFLFAVVVVTPLAIYDGTTLAEYATTLMASAGLLVLVNLFIAAIMPWVER